MLRCKMRMRRGRGTGKQSDRERGRARQLAWPLRRILLPLLPLEDGLRLPGHRTPSASPSLPLPLSAAACQFSFCIFFIFSNCQKLLTYSPLPFLLLPACLIGQSTWSLTFPFPISMRAAAEVVTLLLLPVPALPCLLLPCPPPVVIFIVISLAAILMNIVVSRQRFL